MPTEKSVKSLNFHSFFLRSLQIATDTINAELDWEAIEKLLFEKHNFSLQEEVEYKNGDMIVHKDSIASLKVNSLI